MKKIIITLLFIAGSLGILNVNGQAKPTAKKATTATTATSKKLTKKDGTPDMRMKENKAAKIAPAGPTKKDGTADMRYKANKKAK